MATFEVELIGHFCTVVTVDAEDESTAEENAIEAFENEFYVGGNQGAEGWDDVQISSVDKAE